LDAFKNRQFLLFQENFVTDKVLKNNLKPGNLPEITPGSISFVILSAVFVIYMCLRIIFLKELYLFESFIRQKRVLGNE
jgi:hypothetical protein